MSIEVLQQIEDLLSQSTKPLTFNEARQYLNCSASHLYKLTHLKRIPHYKPQGKRLFFKREELASWLLQNPVKTVDNIDQQATDYVTMNKGV